LQTLFEILRRIVPRRLHDNRTVSSYTLRRHILDVKSVCARGFCILAVLLVIPRVHAGEPAAPPTWRMHAGLSIQDFNYKEFADDGTLLDRENGLIPGVVAGFLRTEKEWGVAGDFSYHDGAVDYTGQTNSGIPITTRSDARIADLSMRVEHRQIGKADVEYGRLYGGLGLHSWERNVRSTQTAGGAYVSGVFEIYQWWYGFIGFKTDMVAKPSWSWALDARLTRTFDPRVHVDFLGLYDNTSLDLGPRFGARLSLPWRYALDRVSALSIEPYFERWDLGRSNDMTLTRGGVAVGGIFEPRSETRSYGLTLSLSSQF
jgi:hypothetical protein